MGNRQSGKIATVWKRTTMQIGIFEIPIPAKKANDDNGPQGIADGAFSAELDEALGAPADSGHRAAPVAQPSEHATTRDARPEARPDVANGQGAHPPASDGEQPQFETPAAAEAGLGTASSKAAEPALQAPPLANVEPGTAAVPTNLPPPVVSGAQVPTSADTGLALAAANAAGPALQAAPLANAEAAPATAPTHVPQAVQSAIDALAAAGPNANAAASLPNQIVEAAPAIAAPRIGIPGGQATAEIAVQQPGAMRPELATLGQAMRPNQAQAPQPNSQIATPQPAAIAAASTQLAVADTAIPETALRPEIASEPAIRAIPATPATPAAPADGIAATPATPATPAVPAIGAPETPPAAPAAGLPDAAASAGASQKPARSPSVEFTGTTVVDGGEPVPPADDGLETAAAAAATAAAKLAGMVEDDGQPQPRAPETAPPIVAALANANTAANANGKPASAARGQATAKSAGGTPSANAATGAANDAAALNAAQPAQASPVRDAALMVANQHLAPGHTAGEQAQPDAAAFREALTSALPEQANPAGGLDGLRPANAASAVPILARAAAHAPVPFADQIAFNIRQAIDNGDTQIRIQLQPQELGRIDVRLEMTDAGKVTALISAERQDTLDMLMRDSRSLEKALQEAGLDVDGDGLAFDLEEGSEDPENATEGDLADSAENVVETDVVMPAAAILSGAPDGVDISV